MSGFVALFEAARAADGITFCFSGKDLLLDASGHLPELATSALLGAPQHEHVIGRCGELRYRLQVWTADLVLPSGWCKADFRKVWASQPQELQPALGRARQLAVWLAESRYCGACGQAMLTDGAAAVRRCPVCGFVAYPRLSPVGMVLIGRGDEVLLARAPHFQPGVYSALAGYVEAGESVEACIAREVQEEVGLRIDNLRWFGSQSWALSNAMMLGFTADYAGGDLVLQPEEIEDARWFSRDALPGLPHPATLAGRMIRAWAAR